MKKINKLLFAFFTIIIITSCQTTKKEPQIIIEDELDFSSSGGETLDGYWNKYFDTKNEVYLEQILKYADSEDLLLAELNGKYESIKSDELLYFVLIEELDLLDTGYSILYDLDTEWYTAFLLQNGNDDSKNEIKYLYSFLPKEIILRSAVKSAAYWSLIANARENPQIKDFINRKLPDLSDKTRNIFKAILEMQNF